MVLELKVLEQLALALCVVAVTSPDFQLYDVLMVVVIYDEVGTGFITSFSLYIIVSYAIDDWTKVEQKLLASLFLHEFSVHRSVCGTEDFVEVFGEFL